MVLCGFLLEGQHLARSAVFQKVTPMLHHFCALFQVGGMVVSRAHAVALLVCQLQLPLRQNSCRPNRTKNPGGGDERRKWHDTDKYSKTEQ